MLATLLLSALALVAAPAQSVDAGPTATAPASAPQATFEQGVDAYRRGDYRTAQTLWRRLLDAHDDTLDPAALDYDLGNAAFRLERPLEAAGWYTAALRRSPRHAEAWSNLELARERAGLDPADRGDLADTLRRLGSALTLAELEWTLVALAAALLVVLLVEALRGGVVLRRTAWGLGALALLLACLWGWRLAGREQAPLFVTEPGGVDLRSEPRDGAAAVGHAQPADVVEALDSLPGWRRVRDGSGEVGWVEESAVLDLPVADARG